MPMRNLNLTDHFDRFVESGVRSGRFSNASEAVGEGLRLLEQRDAEDTARLEWLRAAARDGFTSIDRGEGMPFPSMDDLAVFIEHTGEDLASDRRRD